MGIQCELKPNTEIACHAQKFRWEALALSRNFSLFDPKIQRNPIDAWESDKASEFALILIEKADCLCDLHSELGKVGLAGDRVEPEASGTGDFGYCGCPRRTTTIGFNVDEDKNSSTAKLVPLARRTHDILMPPPADFGNAKLARKYAQM